MENKMQQVFVNLNDEIENLEAHARRIEEMLPHLHLKAQKQWKVTGQARRVYEEELRALLNVVLGRHQAERPSFSQETNSAVVTH
jgi:hypothetical protein